MTEDTTLAEALRIGLKRAAFRCWLASVAVGSVAATRALSDYFTMAQ